MKSNKIIGESGFKEIYTKTEVYYDYKRIICLSFIAGFIFGLVISYFIV